MKIGTAGMCDERRVDTDGDASTAIGVAAIGVCAALAGVTIACALVVEFGGNMFASGLPRGLFRVAFGRGLAAAAAAAACAADGL